MNFVKTSFALVTASLLLAACGGKSAPVVVAPPQEDIFVEHCEYRAGERAPEWYCSPDIEGGIAAIGEAKPNAGNDSNFQRSEAMANARDALARQMEVKVDNMFKNFAQTTGGGDDATYDKATSNVSRQVASETLKGSRQLKRWVAKDGTLVLLVGMSDSTEVIDNIRSSLRNEKALWQQFQAQKAQDELDEYLEKNFK